MSRGKRDSEQMENVDIVNHQKCCRFNMQQFLKKVEHQTMSTQLLAQPGIQRCFVFLAKTDFFWGVERGTCVRGLRCLQRLQLSTGVRWLRGTLLGMKFDHQMVLLLEACLQVFFWITLAR